MRVRVRLSIFSDSPYEVEADYSLEDRMLYWVKKDKDGSRKKCAIKVTSKWEKEIDFLDFPEE